MLCVVVVLFVVVIVCCLLCAGCVCCLLNCVLFVIYIYIWVFLVECLVVYLDGWLCIVISCGRLVFVLCCVPCAVCFVDC